MIASSAARCSVRAFDARSSAVRSATFASRPCGELRVVERDGRLRGEHRDEVAVGVVEAAKRAVDVEVEQAEQAAAARSAVRQARALVERGCAIRHVAQG